MYYEEKIDEHGRWYWRGTPDGEWTRFSIDKCEMKLISLTHRLGDLEKLCNEMMLDRDIAIRDLEESQTEPMPISTENKST